MAKRATKVLRHLRVNEISLVDRPANKGARIVLVKREMDDGLAASALAAALVLEAKDFEALIIKHAGTPMADAARALKASADNAAGDHESSAADFAARLRELSPDAETALAKALSDAGEAGGQIDKRSDDMPKTVESLTADIEALTKRLETAEANLEKANGERDEANAARDEALKLAKMSDAEREHMGALSKDDAAAFMGMSPAQRKKAMAKSEAEDETLTIGGKTIRKSEAGEGLFEVLKAQAEAAEADRVELVKERQARRMAEFEKRAEGEFAHLPGEAAEIAKALAAIEAIEDEAVRKTLGEIMAQHEKLVAEGFDKFGHTDGRPINKRDDAAVTDFEKHVDEIMAAEDVTRTVAMQKAADKHPEAFKKYQESV